MVQIEQWVQSSPKFFINMLSRVPRGGSVKLKKILRTNQKLLAFWIFIIGSRWTWNNWKPIPDWSPGGHTPTISYYGPHRSTDSTVQDVWNVQLFEFHFVFVSQQFSIYSVLGLIMSVIRIWRVSHKESNRVMVGVLVVVLFLCSIVWDGASNLVSSWPFSIKFGKFAFPIPPSECAFKDWEDSF